MVPVQLKKGTVGECFSVFIHGCQQEEKTIFDITSNLTT